MGMRASSEALITLDRIRADVKAEFFVRVKKDNEAIAQAAAKLVAIVKDFMSDKAN
jgi:uncharacterized membrane protein YqiK